VQGIDLSGQTAVVTGASGGLGGETARALASAGAAVLIGCRDLAKGQKQADAIRREHPKARVDVAALDLLSEQSVRSFADAFRARHKQLSILVNNAGVMACPLARTAQGWELQLATNHLGHFLLSRLLMPSLTAGTPSRVVALSSAAHHRASVDFDDLNFDRRPYDKWIAYGQSKTANALFAVGFDRRMAREGVRAFAVHPGAIATELARHLTREDLHEIVTRIRTTAGGLKEVPAGAATSVWAATAPELAGKGGLYLEDCRISAPAGTEGVTTGYRDYALDPELADRLWKVSEALLGLR
jgi:NAD(P)-dependent dehydrogenase (short-subunit alcohol dehydrogenase family)